MFLPVSTMIQDTETFDPKTMQVSALLLGVFVAVPALVLIGTAIASLF